jgi:hypothetical protein
MLRWNPGASLARSHFWYSSMVSIGFPDGDWSAGGAAAWALLPLVVVGWVAGFLGPPAILGAAGLIGERPRRLSWLAGIAAAGLAAALLLDTDSLDQFTFAFGGQILLAVVGGGVVVRLVNRPRLRWVAIPALALVAAPMAKHAVGAALEGCGADLDAAVQPMPPEVARYTEGLDWIKANSSRDAVLVTRHSALATSIRSERRSFYAMGLFTAESHRLRSQGITQDPFPGLLALRLRAAALDPAAVRSVADLAGGHREVLVIIDAVEVAGEPGANWLRVRSLAGTPPPPPPGLALVFASDVMWVYRYGTAAGDVPVRSFASAVS